MADEIPQRVPATPRYFEEFFLKVTPDGRRVLTLDSVQALDDECMKHLEAAQAVSPLQLLK